MTPKPALEATQELYSLPLGWPHEMQSLDAQQTFSSNSTRPGAGGRFSFQHKCPRRIHFN